MKIDMEKLFQHSFVISIDNARYQLFQKIFKMNNLPVPERVDGFTLNAIGDGFIKNDETKDTFNKLNCILSHAFIIKMAKRLDLPYVLIFEDDTYPCRNISYELQNVLNNIPDDSYLAILGYIKDNDENMHNSVFFKYTKFDYSYEHSIFGSHAYVIFKQGYDNYLNILNSAKFIFADMMFSLMSNVYCSSKNLFIQYNNIPSEITSHTGYTFHCKSREEILKEFPAIDEYKDL